MPEAVVLAPELRYLAAQLARLLGEPRLAAAATAAVAHRAPDERLALATLLKLVEESPAELRVALADAALAGDLALCVGGSEVVAQGLGAMGPHWLEFFRAARRATAESIDSAIRFAAGPSADRQEAARRLGEFKLRLFLQIAIADLVGRLDVAATMRAMSRLADECIAAALECARLIVGPRAPAAATFCVLGMGKLGAQELNLSSDIDLIYVFDGPDDDAEAVARLGETLTELLSAKCFRVDMRLRPGGRNSPLVTPFEGALSFYQSFGETWERAALLRARPVAGAREVGRRLLDELGHFVYRRYLDFDTLRQLRAMKHQIERELRGPDLVDRNIKLGYGGIRELEFIVQALILVYGGRDPRLRTARTLAALERLGALGYLNAGRARELAAAYLFLRDVEHKLQVVAALQTHVLPADEAGRRALAARMGRGKDGAAQVRFETELKNHRALVAAQFREMLGAAEHRGGRAASEAAEHAWRTALDPHQSAPMLQALGFARSEESAGHLILLARGPEHALAAAAPRRRELLERLGPLLLDEIRELADPDLALMNLASFIAAIGARSSFLELLEQHPATRRVVLSLFASSAHLSTIFIRHPDMIDTLVRSDLARPRRSLAELDEELRALIAASPDLESRLDAVRAFRHQEFLRIAIADLAGDLNTDAVQTELGLLAEVVLRRALELARAEVAARVSIPPALELVALAMGRLGAAEMSYNSDLDLIFVYHDRGEVAEGSRVAASRIVQKLIAVLEARTREGYAYKIDLRLRPSGNAGPLVASLEGYRDYHGTSSSAVWERQALVRARVIAGEPELAAEVEAARREFVFGRGLSCAEVGEIAAMRLRIERELGADGRGRLNIKQGRGGLVDVEFLSQMMALRYGHAHPELTGRATVALLRGAGQCGLLEHGAAAQLEADYGFLSRLENRLRIETDQAAWALSTEPESLGPLARRMGYRDADGAGRLLAELEACRIRIRATFDECFRIEMSRDG
ncbi:MAG TPA: bifunctional [glutamate--ammonia ligase]-adenylyl-L-tyrosine phosphorylase/[glutamate--ammonia-ligase] adenylyltransferase [Candidatus Binataceae bacterium]|nr:bifunctional [glutamate--ammonia ligase]-adenylyl-L-tyrosine phosphorylase/[glutamate--ammonia-ligase] adenylyltransferase [Candidatus Binataceae bacterium]